MSIKKSIARYKYYLITFLIVEALLFALLRWNTNVRLEEYLSDLTKRIGSQYHVILDAFQQKSEIAFETMIDTPQVKNLLQKALHAPKEERKTLRKTLYNQLAPSYRALQKYGFKQLHFHTPDNHSFLRMHAPGRFGDDLSAFRKTVLFVNTHHQRINCFEEGVANDGYRFLFPLYGEKGYIGSVELSFSAYALVDFMRQEFLDTHFIIAKSALVTPGKTYIPTPLHAGYVEDAKQSTKSSAFVPDERFWGQSVNRPISLDVMDHGKPFIQTYLPIVHPITHKTDAYMIIKSDGKYAHRIQNSFWILFTGLSIIIALLFLWQIRGRNFQDKILQEQKKLERANVKLKTIIDNQENMIIITDGYEMSDANARLFKFLGYQSFKQMKRHHKCICDFFLRHEDYFHLGRVPQDQKWIDYLPKLPSSERIVTMVGADLEPKAFQVNITNYDTHGSSIITLTDITEMVIRQKILAYKAKHDRLTDIYNRQKIDEVLENVCSYSRRRQEHVGILLFDIDHFKKVNDTYGHDVGDKVLQAIATLVKQKIREEDIFGRWGGEEFMVIMRHTELEDAYKKAEALRAAIASMSLPDLPKITASFGVTEIVSGDTTQTLLKRVDRALYQAKKEGRNRVVTLSATVREQLTLA